MHVIFLDFGFPSSRRETVVEAHVPPAAHVRV